MRKTALKIGLTGGIGSGKSTVANYFAKLGVPIIDADKVTHQLLLPNTTVFRKIVARFGRAILTKAGRLKRKKLRELVFQSKDERKWLEQLIHPRVIATMFAQARKVKHPYCILVIPLLFEGNYNNMVDRVLLVDCPTRLQITRASGRDRASKQQIRAIIAAQMSRSKRRQLADNIISNQNSLANLRTAVKKLHSHYLNVTTQKLRANLRH